MAEVVLTDVCKAYDSGALAVDRFNLHIRDKEFLVLVGPSGCGKSTTLRMVAGLETVTSGSIAVDGRIVNDVPPKDRDLAMVFQNYALYPHMTVFENMAFGLRLRRVPRAEIRARVDEAAAVLGLESLLERLPKQLSGGQRQRVAVGRAIVRKPKVFLFDEPLSNLDAKMRVEMRGEIHRLHRRLGATMIYVTHDQVEAMTMGDRIVVMDKGRIQQADDPLTLYNRPVNRFTAGFVGMPPMNFLLMDVVPDGALVSSAGRIAAPTAWLPALAERRGRRVVLGVRPEDVFPEQAAEGLAMQVDVIEPMGAESYVHLTGGDGACVARVAPDWPGREGDCVRLRLRLEKAHLFDVESGVRLTGMS